MDSDKWENIKLDFIVFRSHARQASYEIKSSAKLCLIFYLVSLIFKINSENLFWS